MSLSNRYLSAGLGLAAIFASAWALLGARPSATARLESRPMSPTTAARVSGDRLYDSGDYKTARAEYETLVATYAQSRDTDIQDEVAVARIRLGYLYAKENDFAGSRRIFRQAAEEYGGNGYSSQFGTQPEQALYQAAVTYVAEGKSEEARAAFVSFIKQHQHSPLVHAAFNRLVRLDNGTARPEYERLLQTAVSSREAHLRRQLALCGPKALQFALEQLGQPGQSVDALAELCQTDDQGTTMTGMINALKARGLEGTGLKLAFHDLPTLPLPAIWLSDQHFLVITEVNGRNLEVYDPVDESLTVRELPNKNLNTYTLDIIKITRAKK